MAAKHRPVVDRVEVPMSDAPCPRCLLYAKGGRIRMETVQRLPEGAWAPRAAVGKFKGKCCFDCQAADNLLKVGGAPSFLAARIAVGNDRQEQYRLPGAPMGLVLQGIVRPSKPGDLEDQHRWLDDNNWFGMENDPVIHE